MIIADKILHLRKKSGYSQEELANQLHVSRQSVSKWESAQSIPDITKIIAMAQLFSVSTDYLLREDIESADENNSYPNPAEKLVTIEEANHFIKTKKACARKIAMGVSLCILSPALLILLDGMAEDSGLRFSIRNGMGNIVGILWLLLSVAIAVAVFIISNSRMEPFRFIENGDFELSFNVADVIKEYKRLELPNYTRKLVVSVMLFIVSIFPIIIVDELYPSPTLEVAAIVVLLSIVAMGVFQIIVIVSEKNGYEQLLFEGEFEKRKLKQTKKETVIEEAYWSITTVIYLLWSFLSFDWHITWIVWPIAAILYSIVSVVLATKE
ncbi:MAG: helix-turn-helix transcriptional regulator [Lachnospiraceae bacterium]